MSSTPYVSQPGITQPCDDDPGANDGLRHVIDRCLLDPFEARRTVIFDLTDAASWTTDQVYAFEQALNDPTVQVIINLPKHHPRPWPIRWLARLLGVTGL